MKRSSPDLNDTSTRSSHPITLDVNSVRNEGEKYNHTGFTPEEITILKELIKANVLDDQQDSQNGDLYQRVVTLEKGNKVRTIHFGRLQKRTECQLLT
ncbi:hypothetical protein [Peribacillus frigoritolerans]|uniref:hypothetical protein n=1 Tax=Peribacillus frigoritolerans TaxID=450367 RepID=UPI003F7EE3D9